MRLDSNEARANMDTTSLNLETVRTAPLTSPEKIKLKPSSQKKTNEKTSTKRSRHDRNMRERQRNAKKAVLLLKKSGSELPQLLNKLSVRMAWTVIGVLLSVIVKFACGRGVAFWASKTGFGFGLVWLSWAVSGRRGTVIYIRKNLRKLGLEDEEMMSKLDRSGNDVFVIAALLMTGIHRAM